MLYGKGMRWECFPHGKSAKSTLQDILRLSISRSQLRNKQRKPLSADYDTNSIAVDAACSGNPGTMHYRGVDLSTGEIIFSQGPFMQATNNIGEFLAIVHALALMEQTGEQRTIYSDSKIAISWVKQKKCKTKLPPSQANKKVFSLIERAEKWLHTHTYTAPILKWETKIWGEIPADYGNKQR